MSPGLSRRLGRVRGLVRGLLSNPLLLRMMGSRRFVFCYHDVSDSAHPAHSPLYSTRPELFRSQIAMLSRYFTWASLDELMTPRKGHRPTAALTFDDGFLSVKEVALPLVKAAGIPLALFVCKNAAERNFLPVTTRHLISRDPEWARRFGDLLPVSNSGYGFIQPQLDEALFCRQDEIETAGVLRQRIYLSPDEIVELAANGTLIGSHSATHRVLGSVDAGRLAKEISENASFLRRLGIENKHFALPFGKREHFGPAVLEAILGGGYRFVYTTNPTDFVPSNKQTLLVPRICVAGQSVEELSFAILRTLLQKIDL